MPTRRPPKKRTRRKPEEARALILEAARRVIGELGPDRAGLKEIAAEASVSHALITHYFGTFDNLVEEVVAEHASSMNRDVAAALAEPDASPEAVVDLVLSKLSDPAFGRLIVWAILSGRIERDDFFPLRQQGPRVLANMLEQALRQRQLPIPPREELEALLILISCSGLGYSLGRNLFWGALGQRPSRDRDETFRRVVGEMVRDRLGLGLGDA